MGTLPAGIANQQKADVTGETVIVTVVKGLVDRDCAGRSLTEKGRAALAGLLTDQ